MENGDLCRVESLQGLKTIHFGFAPAFSLKVGDVARIGESFFLVKEVCKFVEPSVADMVGALGISQIYRAQLEEGGNGTV